MTHLDAAGRSTSRILGVKSLVFILCLFISGGKTQASLDFPSAIDPSIWEMKLLGCRTTKRSTHRAASMFGWLDPNFLHEPMIY
jgi:hypothetical protein